MGSMDTLESKNKAGAGQPALSDAFMQEFGKQPIDRDALHKSDTVAARLVEGHFDELANLAERRDGSPSWLKFSATPRTVSYNDLKEMEKLADRKMGLDNQYSKDSIQSMESWSVGWAKVYGTGGGALVGGILPFVVPALQGRGKAVTLGLVALGALAGYKAGEFIGHKSFDDFRANSNYLSLESSNYGDELGSAWSRNAKLLGGAGLISGLAAFTMGAPRIAIGLGIAGIATYLSSPLVHHLGRRSAINELQREAELGRRVETEWASGAYLKPGV